MTILSGRCCDSVLGKRKDTEPCRSLFAEQEQEQEQEQAAAASEIKDAATENKDAAAKYEDAAAEYEDAAAEYEDDASKNKCRICLQVGHWTFLCPYKRRIPEGTEVVGPGYMLVCYRCGRDEFDKLKCCVLCGSSLKRLFSIFCYICRAKDHIFRHCPDKGTDDFTIDIDDYVPPPTGAQGVCAGE